MRLFPTVSVFSILFLISCNTSNKNTDEPVIQTDHTFEAVAIKKAVDDAYQVISFKKGQQLNFDNIKNCFVAKAMLFNFRNDSLEVLTIDQFVELYKGLVMSNAFTSFYEEEIKGTTEQFGRIAHRISTYKTYINTLDSVAERGVNSFQLIKTDKGWKVTSIIWDVESPKLKIPDYYLKATDAQ
jgi:hypothetical protein